MSRTVAAVMATPPWSTVRRCSSSSGADVEGWSTAATITRVPCTSATRTAVPVGNRPSRRSTAARHSSRSTRTEPELAAPAGMSRSTMAGVPEQAPRPDARRRPSTGRGGGPAGAGPPGPPSDTPTNDQPLDDDARRRGTPAPWRRAAPMAKGSRKNDPGVAISPMANTAVAMSQIQRQSSGLSMVSPLRARPSPDRGTDRRPTLGTSIPPLHPRCAAGAQSVRARLGDR